MPVYNLTQFLSQLELSKTTITVIPEPILPTLIVPEGFIPLDDTEVNGQLILRNSKNKKVDAFVSTYSLTGVSKEWIVNFINAISDNRTIVNIDTILATKLQPSLSINKYNLMSLNKYDKYTIEFKLKIKTQNRNSLSLILGIDETEQTVLQINDENVFELLNQNDTMPSSTNLVVNKDYDFRVEYDNKLNFIKINDVELNFTYPSNKVHIGFVTNSNVTLSKILLNIEETK